MRALLSGAEGFVGQWLCRELVAAGWEVFGGVAALTEPFQTPVLGPAERDAVRWVPLDVRRADELEGAVTAARPEVIFHLAGVTFVPSAADDPGTAVDVNVGGAARLLGVVARRRRAGDLDPTLVIIGSAEQYGRHDDVGRLDEDRPMRPFTVYAATKVAQEAFAMQAHRADAVRVVATRSFNHSGPGQHAQFLLPALVRRALALRSAAQHTLRLGNTAAVRDFLHVEDVVRAYRLLAEVGVPGTVYNVCSGEGASVDALARLVLQRAHVDAELATDATLVRPVDVPRLVGDPTRLRATTGWVPTRSREDIIDDLINAAAS